MAVKLHAGTLSCSTTLVPLLLSAVLAMPVSAAGFDVHLMDSAGDGLANAAVVVRTLDAEPDRPDSPRVRIDQIDRAFVPAAITIPVGTEVMFPNKDDIRHHVYSFSEAKTFELPLYTGMPARPVHFPQAGIVTIACNIHDWMLGHIYVVDTPWPISIPEFQSVTHTGRQRWE